jgi:hypothetical protein
VRRRRGPLLAPAAIATLEGDGCTRGRPDESSRRTRIDDGVIAEVSSWTRSFKFSGRC